MASASAGKVWPAQCVLCGRDRAGPSRVTAVQPLSGPHGHPTGDQRRDFCLESGRVGGGVGQRGSWEGIPFSGPQPMVGCLIRRAGGMNCRDWREALGARSSRRHLCRSPHIIQTPGKSEAKSGSLDGVSQASRRSVWSPALLSERQGRAKAQSQQHNHRPWRCTHRLPLRSKLTWPRVALWA